MGYDYAGERKAALDACVEYGAKAELIREGHSFPCHIIFDRYTAFERATSQIQSIDRKGIVAALEIPIVPTNEDTVFLTTEMADLPANSSLRIVTVTPTAPGGINIIFELQTRK